MRFWLSASILSVVAGLFFFLTAIRKANAKPSCPPGSTGYMIVGNDRKCFGANYGEQTEEYEGAPIDEAICVQQVIYEPEIAPSPYCLETIYDLR